MGLREDVAAAYSVTPEAIEATLAIGGRMEALGLAESAIDSLALAEMQRILDGFTLALDTSADGGATATEALASARVAVQTAKNTVATLRSSGGSVEDGQAAVVSAAQALGSAAQAVGAWAQSIAAAIPQG
jgi:hypothetical protein